MISSIF